MQGYGSRMLNFIGTLADADGVLAYLETSGASNEAFYSKGGFTPAGRYPLRAGDDSFDLYAQEDRLKVVDGSGGEGGLVAMVRQPNTGPSP